MMKYERLKENIGILNTHNATLIRVRDLTHGNKTEHELIREIVSDCREILNKIEQGTLIELPCKVGDTVFEIEKDCQKCKHFKGTGWEYDCWCDFDGEELKNMFEVDGDNDCIYTIEEIKFEFGTIPKFGKTVFLTPEEAKARLKEIQK